MGKSAFFKLGDIIYRFRVAILCIWVIIFCACIPFLPHLMTPFQSAGFVAEGSESAETNDFLDQHLSGYQHQLILLYQSQQITTDQPRYLKKIKYSLKHLKYFSLPHEIIYPTADNHQIAADHKTAYAVIFFKEKATLTHEQLTELKKIIRTPKGMTLWMGGEAVFSDSINQQTARDLYHADQYALPLSILVFILVFGSVIAALMPLLLGGGCALVILIGLYTLGHFFHLSVFTINIALLLGLCLSLDYALFIISRFKEELQQHSVHDAICITLATAGKAIFFSGLAVFISLSALLMFPINILFSMGMGGLTAVFFAVSLAMLLLPACLCLLKHRINALSIYRPKPFSSSKTSWWLKLATTVVHHRILFFLAPLALLLVLSYPFLHVIAGISGYRILGDHSDSQLFFEHYQKHFKEHTLTPITVLVTTTHGTIRSAKNIRALYDLTQTLKKNPFISDVHGLTSILPHQHTAEDYVLLYQSLKTRPNPEIKKLLTMTSGSHFTVLTVVSRYGIHTPETKALVAQLRQLHPKGLTIALTGMPAIHTDVLKAVSERFPYVLLWIMCLTYFILLWLLRSVILPLKAILMTLLSLCASYGVLVFVFQEGHLQQWLHFQAQGIVDLNLLIIIFCALFGFSMDYEVFLLTRMHEYYLKTKETEQSIIYGIVKSSRIITSAALIVMVLCGSFMVADVLMVKAFGLGIAVAIFVDAFIIRTLLVPSTMALLKQWSWYYPKRFHKR